MTKVERLKEGSVSLLLKGIKVRNRGHIINDMFIYWGHERRAIGLY